MPRRIVASIESVIYGKRETVELAVVVLLAGGHILLEDIPGMGKTMLARAMARSVDGTSQRIQFTSDLLPSDIVGTTVWNPRDARFEVRQGPVFAHVVLADEINRATPRTQSALLECMGERQVSIDRETLTLEDPFLVIATQNPVSFEGCYPLVESQMDRFWVRLRMGYPDFDTQVRILAETGGIHPIESLNPVVTLDEIRQMSAAARSIHASDALLRYISRLLMAVRETNGVLFGASPRAGIHLLAMSRARAFLHGIDHVRPEDVQEIFIPCLAHRLVRTAGVALDGPDTERMLSGLLERTEVLEPQA